MAQRRFIIGDIRGSLGLLLKLFDRIQPDTGPNALIFLGSYLGPGENSKGVIDFLLFLKEVGHNCVFLRGCYERMFELSLPLNASPQFTKGWRAMGGNAVYQSYSSDSPLYVATSSGGPKKVAMTVRIPEPHLRFIKHDLGLWYETEDVIATHAGINRQRLEQGLGGVRDEDFIFGSPGWWNDSWCIPGKDIVFGHFPFPEPFLGPGKVGIDLGAGAGGRLCCIEYPSKQITIVQ